MEKHLITVSIVTALLLASALFFFFFPPSGIFVGKATNALNSLTELCVLDATYANGILLITATDCQTETITAIIRGVEEVTTEVTLVNGIAELGISFEPSSVYLLSGTTSKEIIFTE